MHTASERSSANHIFRYRLRTENRLLRQRIDYLEQESSALADRLIRGQVNLAQEAENCMSISHELHKLRDINSDAHRRLEEAYDTIRELSCKKNENVMDTGTQVDDTSMIEHIHALQQELIETHVKEADDENMIRDLKQRVQRLSERPPDDGIAGLQEELILVKMREAEASLSIKEMRQRLAELEQQWTRYVQKRGNESGSNGSNKTSTENAAGGSEKNGSADGASHLQNSHTQQPSPSSVPQTARQRLAKLTASLIGVGSSDSSDVDAEFNALTMKELEDQLMGIRIREADTVAELKEMRQKVMELETQNHVCTNQLKRQDEELKKMRDERDSVVQKEKEMVEVVKEERRKAMEAESELKEQSVMQRLKYTEAMQHIADLKQTIAQLELRKAEKWTHAQLRGSSVCDMDDESVGAMGSRHSVASGDALSIGSEDLSALIADMTVRVPDMTDGLLLVSSVDDDGSATETEDRRIKRAIGNEEDGNDTTDSGLQMSDGL
uniref:Ecotropic viral integration site 5 protein homolog n=1 Tax=Syphacia muris TaxID=451379 RepID=A0A158R433_9BILA